METKPQKLLTIGRVAQQADVSIDTVRFYEQRGLLPKPARTATGYRLYSADTVDRLNFIRRSKTLGFTLEEIILLLALQDTSGAKAEVRAITRSKLQQIDRKIDDLRRMRDVLSALEHDCAGSGNARACPIIEALSAGTADDSERVKQDDTRAAS